MADFVDKLATVKGFALGPSILAAVALALTACGSVGEREEVRHNEQTLAEQKFARKQRQDQEDAQRVAKIREMEEWRLRGLEEKLAGMQVTPLAPAPTSNPTPAMPCPGVAPPGGEDLPSFGLYLSVCVGRLAQQKGHDNVYPRDARIQRSEGVTLVSVEFSGSKTKRVWVARSSGHQLLDQSALELVQDVLRHVNVPPPLANRNQFSVMLPIVFQLVPQGGSRSPLPSSRMAPRFAVLARTG